MNPKRIKIILTGATGMVGEGVLSLCLEHPSVEEVLVITRKSTEITHEKFKEIIHPDFFDLSPIEDQLTGYHACFFCAGVSSVGMKEADYFRLTYTLTTGFAQTLTRLNPTMTFCYVSGAGTDSSEKGRLMWARVKGKTENDLQQLPIKVFNFRPAAIKPRKAAQHLPSFYRYIAWIYPIGEKFFPKAFCSTDDIGKAMINVTLEGYSKNILEVSDIKKLAHR